MKRKEVLSFLNHYIQNFAEYDFYYSHITSGFECEYYFTMCLFTSKYVFSHTAYKETVEKYNIPDTDTLKDVMQSHLNIDNVLVFKYFNHYVSESHEIVLIPIGNNEICVVQSSGGIIAAIYEILKYEELLYRMVYLICGSPYPFFHYFDSNYYDYNPIKEAEPIEKDVRIVIDEGYNFRVEDMEIAIKVARKRDTPLPFEDISKDIPKDIVDEYTQYRKEYIMEGPNIPEHFVVDTSFPLVYEYAAKKEYEEKLKSFGI